VDVWDKPLNKQLGDNASIKVSPVFPQFLARTLSSRLQKNVSWQSSGVIGGDIDAIRRECLFIIQEQSKSGFPPDTVIVLCGMNDMKKMLFNPFSTSAYSFRQKLITLVKEIRQLAPNANIVLPAIPSIRNESILNVFPMVFFLERVIRFWDLQKQYVADELPMVVTYIDRPTENFGGQQLIDGISADGVHPNSLGYSKWAEFMGHALADKVGRVKEKVKIAKDLISEGATARIEEVEDGINM